MALIRYFEERVLDLFSEGELSGTTHTYVGQEANAVSVLSHLEPRDIVVSNHRCHGHYLARTGDVQGLLAEMMGKPEGVCGGLGGSQHLCNGNFFSNGIQGSIVPLAAGMAHAEKLLNTNAIAVLFVGDGTFGEGAVYETLNLISLWQVPLLIVVENNLYAQSTPIELNFAGTFTGRAKAFDISVGQIESNDVEELYNRFGPILDQVRREGRPHMEVIDTYRLNAHSKGDDDRPEAEITAWRDRDPLKILGERIGENRKTALDQQAIKIIKHAETAVRKNPNPIFGQLHRLEI